ncbi:MAG: hypothetical protein IJZ59_06560 [Alphaproteobacteria bacterium]|nr:hypothetical protein [Alphaproteobacteria bacterium]
MMFEDLVEDYKNNIAKLISLCEGKTIVFDFDGVLTKFQYAENRMLPCRDDDVHDYTVSGGNIYQNVPIQKTLQYIISQLPKENIWVLTQTIPIMRNIKNEVIIKNFDIPVERIIHSDSALHKLVFLKEIYAQTNKPILFVEDTVSTLLRAEEDMDYVQGFHISGLIP